MADEQNSLMSSNKVGQADVNGASKNIKADCNPVTHSESTPILGFCLKGLLKRISPYRAPSPDSSCQMGNSETQPQTVHERVRCDGCGMVPIVGSRYKSRVEDDYDLCASCFTEIGVEKDYYRVDPALSHTVDHQYPILSRLSSKCLDSEVIQDISIPDGMKVLAGTSFVKVWRIRNVGSHAWPQKTQLVPVQGDILSFNKTVDLEVPADGLPPGQEINISLRLTAPVVTGCCVGHWRLMACGQTFGERMWVVVLVVDNHEALAECHDLTETLPASRPVVQDASSLDEQWECMDASTIGGFKHINHSQVQYPAPALVQDGEPMSEQVYQSAYVEDDDLDFLPMAALRVTEPSKQQAERTDELEGFSWVESSVESTHFDKQQPEGCLVKTRVLEALQEISPDKLEMMSVDQKEIYAELMKGTPDNAQQVLEKLEGLAGWEHALRDIECLGFHDMALNTVLLVKHKGSISRVVKGLVDLERQNVGDKRKEI